MGSDIDIIKARIRELLADEKELREHGQHNASKTVRNRIIEKRYQWMMMDRDAKRDPLWVESASGNALHIARVHMQRAVAKLVQRAEAHTFIRGIELDTTSTGRAYEQAKRDLERAAVRFTAELIASRSGGPHDRDPLELAERVRAAVAFVGEES